jgi:uncharacterized FAD-dependent dehydrogenase
VVRSIAAALKTQTSSVLSYRICRRSLDARKKNQPFYLVSVDAQMAGQEKCWLKKGKNVSLVEETVYQVPKGNPPAHRPVVVGFGPAGMFAALILAEAGFSPVILEQGGPVEEREKAVRLFFEERRLDPHTNIQFGEGGAGAFSDGKLNTGIKDPRIRKVLETFAKHGAPEEILYEAKPHIGTDRLPATVRNIRKEILRLGGEVHFHTQLQNLILREGRVAGIQAREGERAFSLETESVILAIGHSSRETFRALFAQGIEMQAKPFSVGARIEHQREDVDLSQYGSICLEKSLPTADYKASVHLDNGRGVYTFCMCPGGTVVGAASEIGGVVTNGMSPYARDGENSNAAVLVGITPEDFGPDPLSGLQFQEELERKAFEMGGSNYNAPAQKVGDFLAGRPSDFWGKVRPSYQPGVTFSDLNQLFPEEVAASLREGIQRFAEKLRFFSQEDAVLTAPETRSSSPVRIVRDERCESLSAKGLYPCGEGAGYAGGITSAAVDGIKCAEALILHTK